MSPESQSSDRDFVVTNAYTYLHIARESLETSKRLQDAHRRPKPDGSPGWILQFDPQRASFKHSVIAIVFAGVYFEAITYIAGMKQFQGKDLNRFDKQNYEERLRLLGFPDPDLAVGAKRLRTARREIVHEKAFTIGGISSSLPWLTAEEEAEHAVEYVNRIATLFENLFAR